MIRSPHRASRAVSLLLATVTLSGVSALLAWDVRPQLFPRTAHAILGAFPLAMIAAAWLAHHATQRASMRDWIKATLLSAAFLFWAANQCLRDPHAATVCNDIAIALFVLDLIFIVTAVRPVANEDDNIARSAHMPCCTGLGCKMCR